MSPVAVLGILGILGILGLWLLERIIRRSDVGLSVALLAVALDVLDLPVEASLGPIRVTDLDVAFGLLLVAAVARLLRTPAVTPLQWLLLALLGLVAVSTLMGAPLFGVGTALNEARSFVRFLAAVLYFSTVHGESRSVDRLLLPWAAFAGFLLLLTLARWVGVAAGLGGAWWMGATDDLRVIDSFRTLVLLELLLVVWAARPPIPRWVVAVGPVLLAAVVLLQHRTLWIALAVAVLVLGVRRRQIAKRLVPAAVLSIVVGSVLVFTVFGDPTSIREELETSATNADTFEWRVEGWRQLVFETGPATATEIAFGLPFGSGFDRRIEGQLISVTPHNFFVETYLRTGAVGVGLLVFVYLATIRGLRSRRVGRRYLHQDVLLAVVVVQLLFLQTSHPSPEQGVMLGMAVATAVADPARRQVGAAGTTTPAPAPALARATETPAALGGNRW